MAQTIESSLRYDVAFLDFHGTFTSNRGRLAHALNYAHKRVVGTHIPKAVFRSVFERGEGVPATDAIRLSLNGTLSDEGKDRLAKIYHNATQSLYVPKHIHLIAKIRELGARCVIVTNGKEQVVRDALASWTVGRERLVGGEKVFDHYRRTVRDRVPVLSLIEEVYGRGKDSLLGPASVKKKPSPDVIDFVLDDLRKRGLSVRRDRTLMVGDYQDDIGAGNSAGLHTAFMITGPNQKPEYYDLRPTYTLLDSPHLENRSEWLARESVFFMRDLPDIIAGRV